MNKNMQEWHARRWWPLCLFGIMFIAPMLACAMYAEENIPGINSNAAYWTCQTATPIPTRKIAIGTATPPATLSPTATWTADIVHDYTTPVPTETPQYLVEYFYRNQVVHMEGMGLRMVSYSSSANPNTPGLALHTWTFDVWNETGQEYIIPLPLLTAIRNVETDEGRIAGRWHPEPSAVADDIEAGMYDFADGEHKTITFHIQAPEGYVRELLVIGNWRSALEGGTPIYFINESYNDQDGKYCEPFRDDFSPDRVSGSAGWPDGNPPPPPTPNIIGFSGMGGVIGGTGVCGRPVNGPITSQFGCRALWSGVKGHGCSGSTPWFHPALDISAITGTLVIAPISGQVRVPPFMENGFGNHVVVSNGFESHLMAHMSVVSVPDGATVQAGAKIGEAGSTGASTGAHVHWEIKQGGHYIDPNTWAGCLNEPSNVPGPEGTPSI